MMAVYTTLHGEHYYAELVREGGKHLIVIRNRVYRTSVHEQEVVKSGQQEALALLKDWDEREPFENLVIQAIELEVEDITEDKVWWFIPTKHAICFELVTVEKNSRKITSSQNIFYALSRTDAARHCHKLNSEEGLSKQAVITVLETVSDQLRQMAESFQVK